MRPSLDIWARTCTRYAPERAIRATTGIKGQALLTAGAPLEHAVRVTHCLALDVLDDV